MRAFDGARTRVSRRVSYALAALLVCGLVAAGYLAERINADRFEAATRAGVQSELTRVRGVLEGNLNGDIQLVRGLQIGA